MTYLQPHRRPYQRLARIIASIIGIVVLVCAIIIVFAPHAFSALFTTIARPFWRIDFSIDSGSLSSPERLLAENERLRIELEELKASEGATSFIMAENEELKILLGRAPSTTQSTSSISSSLSELPADGAILAAVLKKPPAAPYDLIIIDAGHDRGISTSSMVYAAGRVLIGRVVDVTGETAKVKLFSSPGEKYDVLIGASRIPAVAVGRGGGHYEAQVSRESGVKEGDYVASPGMNDGPFGTVTTIASDAAQPFQTVYFSSSVNIYELRWVVVSNLP